jgi:hypothetical protein
VCALGLPTHLGKPRAQRRGQVFFARVCRGVHGREEAELRVARQRGGLALFGQHEGGPGLEERGEALEHL